MRGGSRTRLNGLTCAPERTTGSAPPLIATLITDPSGTLSTQYAVGGDTWMLIGLSCAVAMGVGDGGPASTGASIVGLPSALASTAPSGRFSRLSALASDAPPSTGVGTGLRPSMAVHALPSPIAITRANDPVRIYDPHRSESEAEPGPTLGVTTKRPAARSGAFAGKKKSVTP